MGIAVLGPLQVDGHTNGLSPRDRVVLSALVVRAGDPITAEAMAQALWGESWPTTWTKVVQGCVVRLRKVLGAAAIESGPAGYRLTLTEEELDHRLFERLLERGRDALAGGDPERSSYLVAEALDLWRGRALADLEEWEPGRVEATRLEGLRMDAEELRVEAETRSGHAPAVLERARALVAQAPFRERRWVLLATALHQAGRQGEALGAVKRARAMLVDELGLDPARELVELEQQLLRQDPSLSAPVDREISAVCPYRGLLPYDAEDSESFFGREDDIAACLRRLRDGRVLAVVGPSGIGKSSLVRAGVVASLVHGGTPVLLTTPGAHPMDSLAGLKARGRQTLVVDQAEEAVTIGTDPDERARYFAALAAHVGAGGALVLSLRADHLGDLAPYPDIARVLEDGLYLLGPMAEPDLRSAIEGPARRAGLRLEPGLVDLLVREVEGGPAALPMLSHVLRETWERREGPTLTVEGYRATGGIRFAVSQSAENLYDQMDESQRTQLRSLLLRLVMPTEDGDPVRARVPRAKIAVDDAHARLVERLVDARLVSIDGDTVQIAHEALVRVWPRLRGWLDDDVDGQRLFRHLAGAADAWDTMGRPDSELYRGARLSRIREWRDRSKPDLDDTETAFLAASVALSETEQRAAETRIVQERRVNRRLRGALAGVGVLLVLTMIAGAVAVHTADRAGRDRDRAEAAADLADARRAGAAALVQEDVATALLLAVSALQADDSPEAWDNLGAALAGTPSLVTVREAGGSVVSLAASGDGALVAASLPGEGEGVQLFDAATLEPVAFEDDTATSSVTFSPDGKVMATAVNQWTGRDDTRIDPWPIRLYDLPSLQPAQRQLGGLESGSAVDYSLGFSRNGKRMAAVVQHFDRTSYLWDDLGAAMVWDLNHPSRPVFSARVPMFAVATLSPDGRHLYAAMEGRRSVRVYDVDTGELIRSTGSPRIRRSGATSIEISPDGAILAVAAGHEVLRFDTTTLRVAGPALRGHTAAVKDLEFSHAGDLLLSASDDRTAIVWDAVSGTLLNRFEEHNDVLWGAAFGADDETLYTSSFDGRILAWDLAGRSGLLAAGRSTKPGPAPYALSLPAPDGHTLARARFGRVWFVDATTGRGPARSSVRVDDDYYVWSPDSRWLLSSGLDALLKLWDASTGQLVASSAFLRGNRLIAVFDPHSDKIYVEGANGVLVTLDRATMEESYDPVAVGGDVTALAVHPEDGSVIAFRRDASFVRVDPEHGKILSSAPAGTLSAEQLSGVFSPDGSVMVAADPEDYLRLLDVDTLDWVGTGLRFPWDGRVSYAPDGSQFATVQADRIRLWDGRTGAYQASVPLPDRTSVSISYLPDSTRLLAAATDGRTWTIDTRTSSWVERACETAGRNLTQDEWRRYFPNEPYDVTCLQWPAGT